MNLEALEEKVHNYLVQVSNPLARMTSLLRHLRDDERFRDVTQSDLLDFLRNHALFRVVEPLAGMQDVADLAQLDDAGFTTETCVILQSRVPTRLEVSEAMMEQLARMKEALTAASEEAFRAGDRRRIETLQAVMKRTDEMIGKLRAV